MAARSRRKFSPQFKAEAVQLVVQSDRSIAEVAGELEINAGTLGNWVKKHREDNPEPEVSMSPADHGRLAALEEQNRKLKMENEFLKKAALDSNRQRNTKQFMVEVDDGQDRPTRTASGGTAAGLGYVEIGIVDQ